MESTTKTTAHPATKKAVSMSAKSERAKVNVPTLTVETLTMPDGEVAEFTIGSGNVFTDLGLEDAEGLQIKAQLIHEIRQSIEQKGLTQQEAAALIGMDQPTLSKMLRGKFLSCSVDRLFSILNRLGRSVEVRIFSQERSPAEAQTSVSVE
jgi:predicted XRE-type DNA-binding protein